MTACNARPPEGHPFYGTGVACHLPEGHLTIGADAGEPHSWDVDAAIARHEKLVRGMDKLRGLFPERPIGRIDSQLTHPIAAYDVDPETGERKGEPYRIWDLPAGPWVLVTYADGEEFAIWKATGDVYRVDASGAVEEDPL